MNLIIPIGGTGERFRKAGILTPKPLIKAGKKRLIELALDSYPQNCRKIAVVSPSNQCEELNEILLTHGVYQINVARSTRGPVETVLSIKDKIDSLQELLIADCDSFLDLEEMEKALSEFRSSKAEGGVTVRKTNNPACSFCLIEDGWVTETRENDPFTDVSTTGPYWFKHGMKFIEAARLAEIEGRYSISPVYNYLPGKTKPYFVTTFRHLGTPESLRDFINGRGPRLQ